MKKVNDLKHEWKREPSSKLNRHIYIVWTILYIVCLRLVLFKWIYYKPKTVVCVCFLLNFVNYICQSTLSATPAGLSVCVRYLTDFQRVNSPSIFTLSPSSRTALKLSVSATGSYILSWDRFSYYTQYMKPNIRFWSNIGPDIWTRVCLTVDPMKNVAQVFSGSNMSIRKILPVQVRKE